MVKQSHISLLIALDLCQPHYQDLLIIYLKFTAKIVEIKISNTYELCNGDINKFVFLLRKGVYLYKYTNSWRRSDETMLPNKKPFYRELNIEDITDEVYTHAQKVFEKLKFKNPGNYHDLYVQSNTLLLSDVFENFKNKCIEIYELDPAYFFICTWISMASLF